MFKYPDPMLLALTTSLQKNFFRMENVLNRRFPKALNSNTAPKIVLVNVDGTLFGLY